MSFVPNRQGGDVPAAPQPYAAYAEDGAITPIHGQVFITKGTAAALTLAAPATAINGMRLEIISTTDAAHTITAAGGFNGGGTGEDVATFAANAGSSLTVSAYNGVWYTSANIGATLA